MWLASLFGGALLLVGSNAFGFECTGVKLASNVVICSDPELIRVADERQTAANEARDRLSPEQFRKLLDEQKSWIAWYSASCGVPSRSSSFFRGMMSRTTVSQSSVVQFQPAAPGTCP